MGDQMRRKVILHGPSSLSVTLPSSWIKKNNLNKGDELDIFELEGNLLVKTITDVQEKKKTEVSFIDISKDARKDLLLALHKNGFDEAKITYKHQSTVKDALSFINEMQLGFELIEQRQDHIILKHVSKPDKSQFNALFRRIFRIMIEYANKIHSVLKESEDITQTCFLHECSMKKLSNFCGRISIKENKQNSTYILSIIGSLESIANSLTQVLKQKQKKENAFSEELINIYSQVTGLLEQIYDLYYSFSLSKYSNVKSLSEKTGRMIIAMKKDGSSDVSSIEPIERMYLRINDIFHPVLAMQL